MNSDRLKSNNDNVLKALMQTVLDNDKSDNPLSTGEMLTEFAIKAELFDDLVNYVTYNVKRAQLLEKFKSDFKLSKPEFAWGGQDYGFGAGLWTNTGLGEAEDRIMPKLAKSLIEMYNTFIYYHLDFDQTKLVWNPDDLLFGMKFETTDGNEDRKVIYGKVVDVLYLFFYKKTLAQMTEDNNKNNI